MDNELNLVRGLPGSGKSTFAKTFKGAVHLEADMYFMKNGVYVFEPTLLPEAHQWCQETCRVALNNGKTVVVSNTFTTHKEMLPYQNMANELNLVLRIWKCVGNFQNTHGVPKNALQAMKERWQDVETESVIIPFHDTFINESEKDYCKACWGLGEVLDGWGKHKHCFKCNGTGKRIRVCKWWKS